MTGLRRLAFFILCVMLPSGMAVAAERNNGPQGTVVYSVGTITIGMNFNMFYRRIALPSGETVRDNRGSIGCGCLGFWRARRSNTDYEGRERGYVRVMHLPPGDYEFFDFGFGGSMGGSVISWSSPRPFSLRFRVVQGETVYIGNFARAPSGGTPLQSQFGYAGYFVVSNKAERDIPIAQGRDSSLGQIRIDVPDASGAAPAPVFARDPLEPTP